jgi:spore photoproduct lyase
MRVGRVKLSALYIDRCVAEDPVAVRIKARFPGVSCRIVQGADTVFRELAEAGPDPELEGKRRLFLTRNRGAFIKACPGTQHYTCCGYKILHIGTYCGMDCSYCILQSYFHPPLLQFFVNHDDLSMELETLFSTAGIHRVGTGEFTDSLIWEPAADLSRFLIPKFAAQPRAVLELKSKTVYIDGVRSLSHGGKTIMAWSLNTREVIRKEERGTASLDARLDAAAKCARWGYPVAFHFDPMVLYEGCEAGYREVVEAIVSRVPPERIVWVSLGTFRFMAALKPIVQRRFPSSKIVYGEFITGLDGKMRYFKPLRIALYRKMVSWFRELAPGLTVYLCMEDDEVWRKALGFIPEERGGLAQMLDEAATRHCGVRP